MGVFPCQIRLQKFRRDTKTMAAGPDRAAIGTPSEAGGASQKTGVL